MPAAGSTLVAEFLGNVNEVKHELEAAPLCFWSKDGHTVHGPARSGSTRSSGRLVRPRGWGHLGTRSRAPSVFEAEPVPLRSGESKSWKRIGPGPLGPRSRPLPVPCGLLKDTANRSNNVLSSLLS